MYSKNVTVTNPTGLHDKAASEFVGTAANFDSRITVRRVDGVEEANAKSIVFLLSMNITPGTEVEIAARGDDEVEAVNTLVELIEAGFGK